MKRKKVIGRTNDFLVYAPIHYSKEPMQHPLEALLPADLVELINFHVCASRIQRRALHLLHAGHQRQAAWPIVRRHFPPDVLDAMLDHASVRRELRTEPQSWLVRSDFDAILRECREGLWGPSQRAKRVRRGFCDRGARVERLSQTTCR